MSQPLYQQGSQYADSGRGNFVQYASRLANNMPFGSMLLDNLIALNPKFEKFDEIPKTREERIKMQSVFAGDAAGGDIGNLVVNKDYQKFIYCQLDLDKIRRLQDYRRTAANSTISKCLDEICDEAVYEDPEREYVGIDIKGEYDKTVKEEIQKEWVKFVANFDFKNRGWGRFRKLLVDGEMFFENVISEKHPEYGVIGLVEIPTELINPVWSNVQNSVIEQFILRKPVVNPLTQKLEKEDIITYNRNQITYISSGDRNEDGTIILPNLEKAKRAYKQLSLIEDCVVIHRLSRSPERLAFNVDCGNMSPPKIEQYMRRLMSQFISKKTFDTASGRTTNVFDPQSMMDAFWFPKRAGTEGTTVTNLTSTAQFNQLDDLLFFKRNVYEAMGVPTSRLNSETQFRDGKELTREEVSFGKYIKRIQKRFAIGLKESFIVHLKLKNLWDQYKLKEYHLDINFNISSSFEAMLEQQIIDLKFNNFATLSNHDSISKSLAQKICLGWDDKMLAINRQSQRNDAMFAWELQQIVQNGPNWKEMLEQNQQAQNDLSSDIMAGGGGGGGNPPSFGPMGSEGGGSPEAPIAPPEGQPPAGGGTTPPAPTQPAGAPPKV